MCVETPVFFSLVFCSLLSHINHSRSVAHWAASVDFFPPPPPLSINFNYYNWSYVCTMCICLSSGAFLSRGITWIGCQAVVSAIESIECCCGGDERRIYRFVAVSLQLTLFSLARQIEENSDWYRRPYDKFLCFRSEWQRIKLMTYTVKLLWLFNSSSSLILAHAIETDHFIGVSLESRVNYNSASDRLETDAWKSFT